MPQARTPAEAEFVKAVDAYVASIGMSAPEETLPLLRDGFDQEVLTELDLAAAGISNVIWATGYAFDFSMIGLPVVDGDGFPIQTRGVSAFPGLFFVGLPWLHNAKSGLIFGVGEDALYIADRIAARRPALTSAGAASAHASPRNGVTWTDRSMTLIWSSAQSLALDGFATYATGIYPTAQHNPPHQADSVVAPADTTQSRE